jgi:hypothetical protein
MEVIETQGDLENQVALELNDIKMASYKSGHSKMSLLSVEENAAALFKQCINGSFTPHHRQEEDVELGSSRLLKVIEHSSKRYQTP